MKLRTKLFIFMLGLFITFSAVLWLYSGALLKNINEDWAERFVKKQIIFDKNRTLLPIMREVSLAKEMSQDPLIIEMALHEEDLSVKQKGIEALERYRLKFQDRSYFMAIVKSQNYYFNDELNQYDGKQLRYVLSPSNANDNWFYDTISEHDDYQINVDKDSTQGVTKVWINFLLQHNGKVIGIIGTGLDFDEFLKESVGIEQEGVKNIFINKALSIQLARDIKLIDYASITQKDGQKHQTIALLLKNQKDIERLKEVMNKLEFSTTQESVNTLWVTFEGKKQLLGIAYLKELGWFSLTLIDSKELAFTNSFNIFPILSILFLVAFFIVGIALNILFLNPLQRLKGIMRRIEKGNYDIDPPIVGTGEIAELSKEFKYMVEFVRANNLALEEKVKVRTEGLIESEQKLNTILDSVEAYIYIKDTKYNYLYANKQTCKYLGKPLEEIIGKDDRTFFDKKTAQELRETDAKVIQYAQRVSKEEVNTNKDGDITMAFLSVKIPLLREDGTIYALCGISTDITERKKVEEMVKNLAFYDTLTKLPNRRMLDERLPVLMAMNKRNEKFGALMFVDLDNFKPLNDSFGHDAGDKLLMEVAQRLLSCVREIDTIARFGGDEFVVALGELDGDALIAKEKAQHIAEKILHKVSQPYILDIMQADGTNRSFEHHCTASIGVTLFGKNEKSKEHILQRADRAMYQAKDLGRNRIEFCEELQ